jgi:hypothetical protein
MEWCEHRDISHNSYTIYTLPLHLVSQVIRTMFFKGTVQVLYFQVLLKALLEGIKQPTEKSESEQFLSVFMLKFLKQLNKIQKLIFCLTKTMLPLQILMLFMKIITVYSEHHIKHINTLCGTKS